MKKSIKFSLILTGVVTTICVSQVFAAASSQTLGNMASNIIGSLTSVTKLITAGAYIAGMGFAMSAILKFKAHKDNAQQTPIGGPIGLTFVAAALIFLPTILSITGTTMFGSEGQVAGPGGTVFTGSN